jgi:hypothetical protein
MTAEILLLLMLGASAAAAAAAGALILAAFGQTGWFVILALIVTGLLAIRLLAAYLAARSEWLRDDLRDEWRSS